MAKDSLRLDRDKIDEFWDGRQKIADPRKSTHFKDDDTHVFDLKLIRKYTNPDSEILDLACGTCFLSNELSPKVKRIKAIDKFGKFLDHCNVSDVLSVEEADILDYKDKTTYDIILAFGIMNYFEDDEATRIYKNMLSMLKPGGVGIVKHQAGVDDDVIVNKYSEQIKSDYHALYRHHPKDVSLMEGVFGKGNVEIIDVYPDRLNPWPNTHFYAYGCKKEE